VQQSRHSARFFLLGWLAIVLLSAAEILGEAKGATSGGD